MATFVFLNVPAHGHVNPTLALAHELVNRGHNVSYYLTEDFRATVEATGAVFQPYTSSRDTNQGEIPNRPTAGPSFLLEDQKVVPPQIIDHIRAEHPDVIIYDFMCIWARIIIDDLHVPAIATRATYASNEHFRMQEQMRKQMQNQSGQSELWKRMQAFMTTTEEERAQHPLNAFFAIFSHTEQLNIIFMPKLFQPAAETFDDHFLFVGPSILSRHEAPDFPFEKLVSERPLLYISLGSIFNNQPAFYQHCFEAFGDQPWQVVLSIGKNTDPHALTSVPDNFLLSPYVPQLDILPRTRLFITHAGTNSIMESMAFGVPMVLIPQQPEQQMHAERVVDLGLGTLLEGGQVNAQTLREAVNRIDHDQSYYERARTMQQAVRDAGGYQRAVDAIVQFAATHARVKQA